jgi:Antibiotic biosynthesis monooxygenase
MIVVIGRVKTDEGTRDALVRIGQAVAAASRKETGCISYRLYEGTELAKRVRLRRRVGEQRGAPAPLRHRTRRRVHAGDSSDDRWAS